MKANIKFIFYNLLIITLIIFIFEILLRLDNKIKFNGSSTKIFTYNELDNYHNTPNFTGISFGVKFYTDKDGYRIPYPNYIYPKNPQKKILIMGDSVSFGAGIEEEYSFTGLLRKNFHKNQIINASVNGYNIDNYKFLTDKIVGNNKFDLSILVLCLNDIISFKNTLSDSSKESLLVKIIEGSRKNKFLFNTNLFLREKSMIYLYIKGIFTDPSFRYFKIDTMNYNYDIESRLKKIKKINDKFISANIPFIVIIAPYEYQIRTLKKSDDTNYLEDELILPQIKLSNYFESENIKFIDPYNRFKAVQLSNGKPLFIKFDPMHLSREGHEIIFSVISEMISNN